MKEAIGRFVEQGARRIGYLGNQNLHCGIDIYKLEVLKGFWKRTALHEKNHRW